jgi:hypothetical protein
MASHPPNLTMPNLTIAGGSTSSSSSSSPPSSSSSSAKDYPLEYLSASAWAAAINYPLWRASALAQSGFSVANVQIAGRTVPAGLAPYLFAFQPPYKGMVATVAGMTWARAAIFWGSDYAKQVLQQWGYSEAVAVVAPVLVLSTFVQVVNQPIIRATITLQNPAASPVLPNVTQAVRHIYKHHGLTGLWHGTSAGILKTVPKYCTAVAVKDAMDEWLPRADPSSPTYQRDLLLRSAAKSASAGIAGAVLTNPLDVIRNEMFKTNKSLIETVRQLRIETGNGFLSRGLGKNMLAVAIPVACTIFLTDVFIQMSKQRKLEKQEQQ